MEQFLGKWVEIKEDVETKRKFMETLDFPKEVIDKKMSNTGFLETVKDGDLFKMTTGFVDDPAYNKSYHFKMNETFSDTDFYGQKFTLVCKVEGNKWYDKLTESYNRAEIENVREVVGDTMVVTTSCDGTSVVSKFKRG
ncbi:uncharacterized protein LOC106876954 [Octopus bimaculoides]|uniref:Lipocalin/cytosolic fatty-acid binding domain-containing protein n=2 Tax=Octopus bimaculoides TaxID=37653 RepID=A0A0L8GGM1_OCTBM|nr:uncharacterized protein LOC106876954 [Octopus bimaculoides]|eukprot:XP_014781209.1 PREDICTED: uncharacterized protein LOC106876954 [Octopus bimaculoides]